MMPLGIPSVIPHARCFALTDASIARMDRFGDCAMPYMLAGLDAGRAGPGRGGPGASAPGHGGQVEEGLRTQPAHLITGAYGEPCSARPRVASQNILSDGVQRKNGLRYARLTRLYSIRHEGACNGRND